MKKNRKFRNSLNNNKIKFYIGDTRDQEILEEPGNQNIDYIFHAAALKQVPSHEILNNGSCSNLI